MFVQVLTVPMCADCRALIATLDRLKNDYPGMEVERVDLTEHPEIAERYGLLSFEYDLLETHAVVIDGELAGTGHPSEGTLRSWLDQASSKRI